MSASTRRGILLLGLLLVVGFLFQGQRGLWEPDEGRYVDVACQMLRSGDWLEPRLHRELPHWTKPPLTYWALAGSIATFGPTTLATRIPLALAFVASVLFVHGLARELAPGRRLTAALVHATSLMPFAASSVVTTDGLLTAWETLSALAFVRALLSESNRRGAWLALAWLALGLAFLTKGPPALLVLLPVVTFRLLRRGRGRGLLGWELGGLIAGIVVAGTWFVVVSARHPGLLDYFLHDEVAARVLSSAHQRNPGWVGAFKAYWAVLLLGPLPWTLPLALALRDRVRQAVSRARPLADRDLFLLLWILLPSLVLLLSQSRQPLYALPFFVPASLLVAGSLKDAWARPWNSPRRLTLLSIWLVALLSLRVISAALPANRDSEAFSNRVRAAAPGTWDELVFVNTRPYWGAALYLGAEVEPVAGEGAESPLDELAMPEGPRLFVVEVQDAEALRQTLRSRGAVFRDFGAVRGWRDYRLIGLEGAGASDSPGAESVPTQPYSTSGADSGGGLSP